ncbi:MAG: glycosyltransferase family 2 protein [Thermoplasmata archaeon]
MLGNGLDRGAISFPNSGNLAAGIVAHNEEHHLRSAVRSLVDQELPEGVAWGDIWVVASGCTDRTVEVAESLAKEDARVHVLVEAERQGKAHALNEVFERARGDALLLLNADATAEPGAVAALVRAGASRSGPFAVMARPVIPSKTDGPWTGTLRSMWSLHHEFHLELQRQGGGAHLSDELLLVSLPTFPKLPDGIINDGSYFGVWLSQQGGARLYAPDARVAIDVPEGPGDHLHQRRRIIFGNAQVTETLGSSPSTLVRYALRSPKQALDLLRRSVSSEEHGLVHLVSLAAVESAALVLATWDRLPPRRDHVRWRRIGPGAGTAPWSTVVPGEDRTKLGPVRPVSLEHRVGAVLGVAAQFGTGVPLSELLRLLPEDAPKTIPEVRDWLRDRPHLAHVEDERAFAGRTRRAREAERIQRGLYYMRSAERLVAGPLQGVISLARSVCVTGSTAYGAPEPGDDLDLFVVTKTGGLWWFAATTYLALRLAQLRRARPSEPTPCFNLILDEREATEEFARSRGFLFAREALSARPVHGPRFYRGLLSQATWMSNEIPRLYAEQNPHFDPTLPPSSPVSSVIRLLNAMVFPWVAAYLQFVGLRRDARFRRSGRESHRFRTETRWRRLAFNSRKFERLRETYRSAASTVPDPSRSSEVSAA